LMALPEGRSASIPEPSYRPSMAQQRYSEAIGFTDYPSEWLPFIGTKSVSAFEGSKQIGGLSAGPADEFTASLFTSEQQQIRYALTIGLGWSVEQGIEIATNDDCLDFDAQDEEVESD
jgi:hypothetical protein